MPGKAPAKTFAGLQIAAASEKLRIPIKPLAPGDTLLLQPDCRLETLWPPAESDASQTLSCASSAASSVS